MAGAGTGYPLWFHCPVYRRLDHRTRSSPAAEVGYARAAGRLSRIPALEDALAFAVEERSVWAEAL